MVDISQPTNTITTTETFSTNATATSAVVGIYNNMSYANGSLGYSNGGATIYQGMSADELINFSGPPDEFLTNSILPNNGSIEQFWSRLYFQIYMSNAVIEGLHASIGVSEDMKRQLTGEAKFIRAFSHFYLVNIFGDVPLLTTTSWATTSLMTRTPSADVYQQVIDDLMDAQNLLNSDYSLFGGERVRANKWAATALLARVYMYNDKVAEAETQASLVIDNATIYSLNINLTDAFKKNNSEAILQLQVINQSPWATKEADQLIPNSPTSTPNYYLTNGLLASFEVNDKRKSAWVDSVTPSGGIKYYFPSKYKLRQGSSTNITEYYDVLRLAEQILIRAEARARQGNLIGAISDLNTIRKRAGLQVLSPSLTNQQVIAAIEQERKIELFCEWGHRWLDLKRWQKANTILGPLKGSNWQTTDELYPIPMSELLKNPNLTQNTGY